MFLDAEEEVLMTGAHFIGDELRFAKWARPIVGLCRSKCQVVAGES